MRGPHLFNPGNQRRPGAPQPGAHDDRRTALPKLTAVIVEDDFLSLIETEYMADEAGLSILATASNPNAAVAAIELYRPDIVLMDVNLGKGRDGIDIAIEANRRFGTRCLFTTAYSDELLKKRAQASNPLGWVNKPFSNQVLQAAISAARDRLKSNN